jgi:hypothetical protein
MEEEDAQTAVAAKDGRVNPLTKSSGVRTTSSLGNLRMGAKTLEAPDAIDKIWSPPSCIILTHTTTTV